MKCGPASDADDPLVVRHSDMRCSYKCHYYEGGAAMSYCNKYRKPLKYDGRIPPLLTDECRSDLYRRRGPEKGGAVVGIGRDAENPRILVVYFKRDITDDDMRDVHECLKRWYSDQEEV